MAGPSKGVSKTARASTRMNKGAARPADLEGVTRLVSLDGGRGAYLFLPGGRTVRANTNSAEFDEAVAALAELGLAAKVDSEIAEFVVRCPKSAWPAVQARMLAAREAGVEVDDAEAVPA